MVKSAEFHVENKELTTFKPNKKTLKKIESVHGYWKAEVKGY